jgi:ABC-type multidrug transport system ATPase subunit
MQLAHEDEAIIIHRDEIKSLAREPDPTRAIKRALDFARDFSDGRKFENEAVMLSSRFNRVREDQRKNLRTPEQIDVALAKILTQLLELVDSIYDSYMEENVTSIPPEERPQVEFVDFTPPRPHKPSQQESQQPLKSHNVVVSYEEARRRFRNRWHKEDDNLQKVAFYCRNLRKRYRGKTYSFLLSDISLELKPGEITGLVGVNGAGKTTLLRIIAGELSQSSGELGYPLFDAGSLNWRKIRHQIGYMQQLPDPWYGQLDDNLHLIAANHGLTGKENQYETDFILHRLGLDIYRDAKWNQISGGYKMRFELAKALVSQPRLLILDEPLAPLDIVTQQWFLKDLRDLANSIRNPLSIIVSSQHLYEIESIADQILFLDDGKPAYYGSPTDIGADRAYNMFELSSTLTSWELYSILDELEDLYLEEFGLTHVIQVARSVSGGEVVKRLIGADVPINYFRDISNSSRMLFDKRGRPQ